MVTAAVVCQAGYTAKVRNVSQRTKNQVFAEYHLTPTEPGQYEIDHFIPLELGGSNDLPNLWPEAASPRPGFHEKDQVENYLHSMVCAGKMPLQQAQSAIVNDWLGVYQSMPASRSFDQETTKEAP